jgi:hypothetical protein
VQHTGRFESRWGDQNRRLTAAEIQNPKAQIPTELQPSTVLVAIADCLGIDHPFLTDFAGARSFPMRIRPVSPSDSLPELAYPTISFRLDPPKDQHLIAARIARFRTMRTASAAVTRWEPSIMADDLLIILHTEINAHNRPLPAQLQLVDLL